MVDYHYDVSFSMFCQLSSTSNRVSCHKVHQSLMRSMVHGKGLGGGGGGGVQNRLNGVNIVDSAKLSPISSFLWCFQFLSKIKCTEDLGYHLPKKIWKIEISLILWGWHCENVGQRCAQDLSDISIQISWNRDGCRLGRSQKGGNCLRKNILEKKERVFEGNMGSGRRWWYW